MTKKITYTEAYDRLQEILRMIETGQLEVDELSEKIKEAGSLLKFCRKKLLEADEEVKKTLDELTQTKGESR